ncbi:MAG: hypothetical protein QNK03_07085 [Myxococcota bacterium]|nr:hypothetical protein [Myxococcota bacterium]
MSVRVGLGLATFPVARGVDDVLEQTRRLVAEVLPVLHAPDPGGPP